VKRSLPTVKPAGRSQRAGKRAERIVAPRERADAPLPLITIGWTNHAREAIELALQLCAALAKRGVSVAALLASTPDDALEGSRLGAFLEAGASGAKSVTIPAQGGAQVLDEALDHLSGATIVLAVGNVVPHFYLPFFSIVVTGHRRQLVSDDAQVLRADLEITSASEGLPDELAKILQSRLTSGGSS
jgi:hypothetical protein